jgi:hypothetical protein
MGEAVLVSVVFGIVQLLVMASRTEKVEAKPKELLAVVRRYR